MATLTKAHRQLFDRPDDERFASLATLGEYCRRQRDASRDRWIPPSALEPHAAAYQLQLAHR